MFWNKKEKIDSEEYLILKQLIDRLRIDFTALSLDLQLYTKKLKASKGLKDRETEEGANENNINQVILPI